MSLNQTEQNPTNITINHPLNRLIEFPIDQSWFLSSLPSEPSPESIAMLDTIQNIFENNPQTKLFNDLFFPPQSLLHDKTLSYEDKLKIFLTALKGHEKISNKLPHNQPITIYNSNFFPQPLQARFFTKQPHKYGDELNLFINLGEPDKDWYQQLLIGAVSFQLHDQTLRIHEVIGGNPHRHNTTPGFITPEKNKTGLLLQRKLRKIAKKNRQLPPLNPKTSHNSPGIEEISIMTVVKTLIKKNIIKPNYSLELLLPKETDWGHILSNPKKCSPDKFNNIFYAYTHAFQDIKPDDDSPDYARKFSIKKLLELPFVNTLLNDSNFTF